MANGFTGVFDAKEFRRALTTIQHYNPSGPWQLSLYSAPRQKCWARSGKCRIQLVPVMAEGGIFVPVTAETIEFLLGEMEKCIESGRRIAVRFDEGKWTAMAGGRDPR